MFGLGLGAEIRNRYEMYEFYFNEKNLWKLKKKGVIQSPLKIRIPYNQITNSKSDWGSESCQPNINIFEFSLARLKYRA